MRQSTIGQGANAPIEPYAIASVCRSIDRELENVDQTHDDAAAAALRALVETWITATKAGDHERVLALVADDALFLMPGREPFGKAVFANMIRDQKSGLQIDGTSEVQEIQLLGDWAFMRSRLRLLLVTRDGSRTRQEGETLSILRKDASGRWLLVRDANMLAMQP